MCALPEVKRELEPFPLLTCRRSFPSSCPLSLVPVAACVASLTARQVKALDSLDLLAHLACICPVIETEASSP
jgi:hypothetical protein